MKTRTLSLAAALALFAALVLCSAEARLGAAAGLRLWSGLLVPSLLPYFAAAGLLTRLGLTEALGRRLAPAGKRLLGVSPAGVGIFLLGLSGGYPLGAAAVSDALRSGRIGRDEAQRLLFFCDNTGPAFAVGALGVGIFHRAELGLALWGVHALCALILGVLFRGGAGDSLPPEGPAPESSFAGALTASVAAAVSALLSIGGYVAFFSALLAVAERMGFPGTLASLAAARTGWPEALFRALFTGLLELSSGIGALGGAAPDAAALTLGSFLLGWGGVCVHLQTAAVTAGTGLSLGGRLRGKLLHGLLSAAVTALLAPALL